MTWAKNRLGHPRLLPSAFRIPIQTTFPSCRPGATRSRLLQQDVVIVTVLSKLTRATHCFTPPFGRYRFSKRFVRVQLSNLKKAAATDNYSNENRCNFPPINYRSFLSCSSLKHETNYYVWGACFSRCLHRWRAMFRQGLTSEFHQSSGASCEPFSLLAGNTGLGKQPWTWNVPSECIGCCERRGEFPFSHPHHSRQVLFHPITVNFTREGSSFFPVSEYFVGVLLFSRALRKWMEAWLN